MIHDPAVLILDEPTNDLDLDTMRRLEDFVLSFKGTIIVVSHDLRVIRLLAERVVVLKNGRIVEAGLTDQILEDPQHEYTQKLVSSIL